MCVKQISASLTCHLNLNLFMRYLNAFKNLTINVCQCGMYECVCVYSKGVVLQYVICSFFLFFFVHNIL